MHLLDEILAIAAAKKVPDGEYHASKRSEAFLANTKPVHFYDHGSIHLVCSFTGLITRDLGLNLAGAQETTTPLYIRKCVFT